MVAKATGGTEIIDTVVIVLTSSTGTQKTQSTAQKEKIQTTPYSLLFQCPVLQINLKHFKLIDRDDAQSFLAAVLKRQLTWME